jgi:hypothetical protein
VSRRLKDVYARPRRGKLLPSEMALAMKQLGLTDQTLCDVLGNRLDKVVAWRKGEDDIPDMLALLLAAWTVPGAITASRKAAEFLSERGRADAEQMSAAE